MRKNIAHLQDVGPTTPDDLPYSLGPADKIRGARVFKLTSAPKTKMGGLVTPVYYLGEEHSREDVLRAFLTANPQLVESLPRKSLHRMIGGHGDSWREVAPSVTAEFYVTSESSTTA